MAEFSLITLWRVEAPVQAVWEAIYHSEQWPTWWKYVARVVETETGNSHGVGAVRRYTWRTRLPYEITFNMRTTQIEPPFELEGLAYGELEGTGRWRLYSQGAVTVVRYEWNVKVTKPWMVLLAPIARPVFEWNHDGVMAAGGEGLAKLLGAPLL